MNKIFFLFLAVSALLAVPFNKNLAFGYGSTLGTTAVNLPPTTTQDTPIDLTSFITTVTGGNIGSQSVAGYSGGSLSNVDLTDLGIIGGQPFVVDKAVTLVSSTPGNPITINSNSVANVSITIPDNTTILAPSSWDGFIAPPAAGANTGTAPSGFSVGNTVVEVGSSTAILLFDQPIDVVLTGVTGTVGYKSAGSTAWVQITNVCGGTYANPTAPAFPGECYISDGANTKIHTFHLTSFAALVANTPSSNPSSPGSILSSIRGFFEAIIKFFTHLFG